MGWLSKFFKGSSHRVSEGQYHGRYENDGVWNEPFHSLGTQDALPDYESNDIDSAIALPLSEEEHKKAKVTGECQITGTQGFLFLTIIYFDAVGCVLDVIMRLVMGVFLVAWMLIGIQNVFVAIPVNNQYLITSSPCLGIIHTINLATGSFITRNVMYASSMWLT
ncbi:uncharacterized protein LOC122001063 isoform X1 [Zingiber officinale]|uniref:uncharacterized protein LOC122001063 isoform X1 n=1 Tax=Zingiber officinale TaxID=94328 RepID=UPI001C4DCE5D|nr:uncharacterized protein LOC122001063 isoform X1 [Zingiber officinale]XP_042411569.1 uncharacterized protein LOC122001063 isoform X1 [Zingiber officinale]XP_042411570.1 uncharacterized protein LOC122001063 isoform X1 [Zingiber officinale]